MTKNIKQIIIAVVIIIIAFVAFKMFYPSSSDTSLTAENSAAEFADGQVILAQLKQLENLKLDNSIFSDPAFISLTSFERELEVQVPYRKNPFLPIGIEDSNLLAPRATTTIRR